MYLHIVFGVVGCCAAIGCGDVDAECANAGASLFTSMIAALAYIEARKWRTQRREERRSEVAAQVLGATLRFTSALLELTFRPRFEQERTRALVQQRWTEIQNMETQFTEAWDLARVYLAADATVTEFLDDLWQYRNFLKLNQVCFLRRAERVGPDGR